MALTTHQKTTTAMKTIQCRWNGKQSRAAAILHEPSSPNGRNQNPTPILPSRPRGPQSHIGILLVCSHPTTGQLEERVDRPRTASHNPLCKQRQMSSIYALDTKRSQKTTKRPILYWVSHSAPDQRKTKTRGPNPP
jgi:hypothetical protein